MNLFPYKKYKYNLNVTKIDFIDSLESNIKKSNYRLSSIFGYNNKGPYMEGRIHKDSFKLYRIEGQSGQNGLRPVVIGKLKESNNKTILIIILRPHVATAIGLSIWIIPCLFLSIISYTMSDIKGFVITFFLGLLGYGFWLLGFNSEINYHKNFIEKIIKNVC